MSGRFTGVWAEVYVTQQSDTWFTLVYASNMGRSNATRRRITQSYANLMATTPANTGDPETADANTITQVYANCMIPFTPNFEWIVMFKNEVFPHDISYNSISATRFSTDVAIVDSGYDQRTSRWTQPLMEFDVAYGVRTMEHLHDLIAFFRAMHGRQHAFLYKDHMDYTSTLAVKTEARSAPPITWNDQWQMQGNHVRYQFQLRKLYKAKGQTAEQVRPIYKPKPGTLVISADGIQIDNWVCDYNTGKVEFVSNLVKAGLNGMSIQPHAEISGRWVITGPNGWTAGFNTGDKIVMQGWLNSLNVNSLTQDVLVATTPSATQMQITPQYENFGEPETNRNGVTISRHPAPRNAVVIRAGYEFYVPVRFDTDRLPTSLEVYGVGGAAEVRLVEVRPNEEDL